MMRLLAMLSILALGAVLWLSPAGVRAVDVISPGAQGICSNTKAAQSSICKDNAAQQKSSDTNPVASLIGKISTLVAIVAGIAAVIMIIISGFKFVTSAGDAQKVAGARNTLVWSVVGLIVVAFAAVIISFIMSKL